jgi:hypothetical protein
MMDTKTRAVLTEARQAVLFGRTDLASTLRIVEAIDEVLEAPQTRPGHRSYCTDDRCYCGSQ